MNRTKVTWSNIIIETRYRVITTLYNDATTKGLESIWSNIIIETRSRVTTTSYNDATKGLESNYDTKK